MKDLKLHDVEIPSPCMKCADRVVGCHSTCKKYAAYKILVERQKEKEDKRRRDQQAKFRGINEGRIEKEKKLKWGGKK